MQREISWTAAAERDLRHIRGSARERVREAIYRLAATGTGDVVRLHGREREWRLRVGDLRVLFSIAEDTEPAALIILRVLPRGRAYRD